MKKTQYFSHDVDASQHYKILKMEDTFKKVHSMMQNHAVGTYWKIIEYLHKGYPLKDSDIPMHARNFKTTIKVLYSILNDFNLFKLENGQYLSSRVLENFDLIDKKSKKYTKKPVIASKDEAIQFDEETAAKIKELFCTTFEKDIALSKTTQTKIIKINKDENLSLEQWKTIFSNAKRGWLINGESVKPSLKTILDNWERFLNDDYNLVPAGKSKKEQKNKENIEADAKKQLDTNIETELFIYDEYRNLKPSGRLAAQNVYKSNLAKGNKEAVKRAVLYCREAVKNA